MLLPLELQAQRGLLIIKCLANKEPRRLKRQKKLKKKEGSIKRGGKIVKNSEKIGGETD